MTSLARCYLLMGNWEYAKLCSELVLESDPDFVKAIYARAEALYNTCQFEHALVLYHRGKVKTTKFQKISFLSTYVFELFPKIVQEIKLCASFTKSLD